MSHERWQGTGREVAGGEVEGATLALTQDPARVRSVVGGHAAVTGGSWCPLWTVPGIMMKARHSTWTEREDAGDNVTILSHHHACHCSYENTFTTRGFIWSLRLVCGYSWNCS